MASATSRDLVVFIGGMTCQSCVKNIESTVGKKPGIRFIKVDLDLKSALILYDPQVLGNSDDIVEAIDDMGFEANRATDAQLTLSWISVEGMTCQSCVSHIETTLKPLIGVRDVKVSLKDCSASVLHDSALISAARLAEKIDDIGFGARPQYFNSDVDEFQRLAVERTGDIQPTSENCPPPDPMRSVSCRISIEGMTCMSCVRNIESTVSRVDGIESIEVSLEKKSADVKYNPVKISREQIVGAIDDMGFDASADTDARSVFTTRLSVSGMHCKSCVRNIEGHLKDIAGVSSAVVSLELESCQVIHDVSSITAEQCRLEIEKAGNFTASVIGISEIFCNVLLLRIGLRVYVHQSFMFNSGFLLKNNEYYLPSRSCGALCY